MCGSNFVEVSLHPKLYKSSTEFMKKIRLIRTFVKSLGSCNTVICTTTCYPSYTV